MGVKRVPGVVLGSHFGGILVANGWSWESFWEDFERFLEDLERFREVLGQQKRTEQNRVD